jgi:hypothetical protein
MIANGKISAILHRLADLAAMTDPLGRSMKEDLMEFEPKHRLLLVSIARAIDVRHSYYDAARYAWPLNQIRASSVEYVLACINGVVEAVFEPTEWLDASSGETTNKNFADLLKKYPMFRPADSKMQKLGFRGSVAQEPVLSYYRGKRVPSAFRIGQNGFRYVDPK